HRGNLLGTCYGHHGCPSAIRQPLQLFGVPGPLHRDLGSLARDLTEIVRRKFDGRCSDVLLDARQLRSARDGSDPRLLCKQPCERDLSGCRFLPFRDAAKQINQGLIHLPSLRCEARDAAAEVGTGERSAFVDFPSEESLSKRTVRNEADPQFLERWQYFGFMAFPPERVFALDRSNRLNCVRPADGLRCCFGKAEVLHFALLNQILHRSRYVFDRHFRVNTVLIKQIDRVDLESFQSEPSTPCLMYAGRLSRPTERGAPPCSNLKPNFVAITTCPRNGARASPTSSSLLNGP